MKEQEPSPQQVLPAGEIFARIVRSELGACMQYTRNDEALIPLGDNLLALGHINPDLGLFATEFENFGRNTVNNARAKALEPHTRMLKNVAKIQIISPDNPDETKWKYIEPPKRQQFADSFLALTVPQDDFPSLGDGAQEMLDYGIEVVGNELKSLIEDFHNSLPMHQHDKSKLQKISAKMVKIVTRDGTPGFIVNTTPHEKALLLRKARKLNDWLTGLIEQPEKVLAKVVTDEYEQAVFDTNFRKVEASILAANTQIFRGLGPRQKVAYQPTEKLDQEEVTEASTDKEPAQKSEANLEFTVVDKGEPLLKLPWVYNSKPTPVPLTEVSVGGQTVYIARGISDNLLKIGEVCRKKATSRADGLNEYDYIAQLHARRIAEGIMPYQQSSSSVRRLKVTTKSLNDPYKDLAIWYSFTANNNSVTSRLYYTLKKMSDILPDKTPSIKMDSLCLVVLAETDKEYQTEVVKAFGAGTKISKGSL